MSSPPEPPTNIAIVIVQGSIQPPLVYKQLHYRLTTSSYPTHHPELPSLRTSTSVDLASLDLASDTTAVEIVIRHLVEENHKRVIVFMHSYGGLVGSNAVPKDLGSTYRKTKNLPSGIIHLFYLAAFILDAGHSVLAAFGVSPNDDIQPNRTFTLRNAADLLYSSLPSPKNPSGPLASSRNRTRCRKRCCGARRTSTSTSLPRI